MNYASRGPCILFYCRPCEIFYYISISKQKQKLLLIQVSPYTNQQNKFFGAIKRLQTNLVYRRKRLTRLQKKYPENNSSSHYCVSDILASWRCFSFYQNALIRAIILCFLLFRLKILQ